MTGFRLRLRRASLGSLSCDVVSCGSGRHLQSVAARSSGCHGAEWPDAIHMRPVHLASHRRLLNLTSKDVLWCVGE